MAVVHKSWPKCDNCGIDDETLACNQITWVPAGSGAYWGERVVTNTERGWNEHIVLLCPACYNAPEFAKAPEVIPF